MNGSSRQWDADALVRLWESKRGAREMPTRRDIDATELKPWMGKLAILEVIDGGDDFRYRLYGSKLRSRLACDHTGRRVSELALWDVETVLADYRACVVRREPVLLVRQQRYQRRELELTKLMLPLSVDAGGVDQIITLMFYRPDVAEAGIEPAETMLQGRAGFHGQPLAAGGLAL